MKNCKHCGSTNTIGHGVRGNSIRVKCSDCNKTSSHLIGFADQVIDECLVERISDTKKYVITSCQNNAPVNQDFLSSLAEYCKIEGASLLIVPILYKSAECDVITYDIPENIPHEMISSKVAIHDEVFVMGSFNFIPTAVNPLSGLESLSKGDTLIVPSPQLRMKAMAVSPSRHPAILHTTGAISHPTYAKTKVGEKAKFNHSYSAVLVEIDSDNDFHVRVLSANDDGSFFDLDKHYSSRFKKPKHISVGAIVTGDEHAVFTDLDVLTATYMGQESMVKVLDPKYVVRHDVLDMYSGSHHHRNNSIKTVGKRMFGLDKVEDEIRVTVEYLEMTNSSGNFETIIVPSNHTDHLTKWLAETDIKKEPWNAVFYHEMMFYVLKTLEKSESGVSHADPFEIYCKNYGLENTRFLKPGEPFTIERVEMGSHGHEGRNGSRGSLSQYADLSGKYVIGHSHTPGIISGAYQVGTSSILKLEYTSGPSSWMHTHCIVHTNGKRQLINIINGKWRA